MSNSKIISLDARIVRGEKNIYFIYPIVIAEAEKKAVEIFSVELDGHELVPSARGEVSEGENRFELLPVTIVNPAGSYKLTVKYHPAIGAVTAHDLQINI